MGVFDDIHATASQRRRLVAEALSQHLDPSLSGSTAARLAATLDQPRPMLVSADIDGLVTAAMIASVAPDWRIVGFVQASSTVLLHPSVTALPADVFGVDLFSPRFDCVSNHPVLYGSKNLQNPPLRTALQAWDTTVTTAAASRTFVAPSLWANIQAGYEGGTPPTSAKYKYPLGSAQVMLALLEAIGRPPRFYDRTFLPWLVANCDGGADSHVEHAYNTSVWWSTMAAIVGPGSLTERVYDRVDSMRPQDLRGALNALSRERAAEGSAQVLKDNWNMTGVSTTHLQETLAWLVDLAVWPDPVIGGIAAMDTWVSSAVAGSGLVYIDKSPPQRKNQSASVIDAKTNTPAATQSLQAAAQTAINANFYVGGQSGSRFNWVGL